MASSSKEMSLAIKIAGKVDSSLNSALSSAGSGIKSLTKTITAATAAAATAVGAIATAAINVGKEFESAMSQVQATMLIDTSTEEGLEAYNTLEEAARECGKSTAFSATEAAEALNYLALAGYDASEAATALPAILNLAGAGAMDLATASDMVTDAMSALQLEVTEENLNAFTDQLAKTASSANTSVEQLGEGILTVGATAANLAGGTTELNTALGILADNGIKGSEGGTHLRNVILKLQQPTSDAAALMDDLGVSVYDAEGNMNSLQDIFGDLSDAMEGMSQQDIDTIMGTLFNKTDLASANALLASCGDRWDELSDAIENSAGACEDMYNIQLDNLNGDIDILKSGLSDLGISIYQDLNGPLRSVTQMATDMVGELSAAYDEGGLQGMIGAVGDCLGEVVSMIAEYMPQVVEMGISLISSFIDGITQNSGAIADAAGEAISAFIDGLFTLIPQVLLAGIDIIVQLADSMTQQIPELFNNGTEAITNFVSGIVERLPDIIQTATDLIQTLADSLVASAPELISAAIELIGNLIIGFVSMLPSLVQTGLQLIVGLAQGILENIPLILQMAVQIVTTLINSLVAMLPSIIQAGIQLIISLVQGIAGNLGTIVESAVQIVLALVQGLLEAIPMLISAIPQLIGAMIETIFSTNWLQVGIDIITSIVDGILGCAKSIGSSVLNAVKGFFGFGKKNKDSDVVETGESLTESYAEGIENGAAAVNSATSSLTTSAFEEVDYSAIATAGTNSADAYMTGITDSFADYSIDTSLIGLDSEELTASLTAAAAESGTEFTTSLNDAVTAQAVDTSDIEVDTDGLIEALSVAGEAGSEALAGGMTGNMEAVTSAAADIAASTSDTFQDGWETVLAAADTAMTSLTEKLMAGAQAAAAAVKSAFENMTLTIPKPKIPVITTTYRTETYGDGGSVKLPEFSVNWNAAGGILEDPTILNTASNGLQGVGEAGPEAILPLDTLWDEMRNILAEVLQEHSGLDIIDALISRLESIGSGSGGGVGELQLAGDGGAAISYSPV